MTCPVCKKGERLMAEAPPFYAGLAGLLLLQHMLHHEEGLI